MPTSPSPRRPPAIDNHLAAARAGRGIAAAELAAQVGVRRQTIYAIEAGSYLPNTELALRLADVLGVPIDQLFALRTTRPVRSRSRIPTTIGEPTGVPGTSVHLCRVGDRWLSIPVSAEPYYVPVGDGVVAASRPRGRRAPITMIDERTPDDDRVVLAGCDPAALLLARLVEQDSGVRIVPAAASSRAAIRMLCENAAHIAGSHLEDVETGEFNLPLVRGTSALDGAAVVTMARWEVGFVVAAGNPKRLHGVDDLARPTVTFVNREPGSGSRTLLGKLMKRAGVTAPSVRGFNRTATGHLAAAYRVASGDADVCLATRSAARTFGLSFVPLQSERYDFIVPKAHQQLPAVRRFLDAIQSAAIRRKFAALTSYDTADMGRQIA
jgi:molybdate-binding protein/DNA-binding XRE family transcriptional regulator